MVRIAVVNSPKDKGVSWQVQTGNWLKWHMPSKGASALNLTSQVEPSYLRTYEYWLHLIHSIKDLGISIRASIEYPTLYN
jgi:hypothetical protein